LTSLSLLSPRTQKALVEGQLVSILDHCPHVQSLVLLFLYSTPLDVLLWIDQRCPALRHLRFHSLTKLSSRVKDRARWSAATTGAVAFAALVSLTITSSRSDVGHFGITYLIALLRLAPRLRFLHLDLAQLPPQQVAPFAALSALRGLRLGAQNHSRMKEGEHLKRCWRQAGGDPKGVAAQYSRVQHSNTSLWWSPHHRPDWIGSNIKFIDDDGPLRSTPPTDREIEDEFWSWGDDACGLFVESVDGLTGREAFFAAFAPAPPSTSDAVSATGAKRKRAD
jgi:hypothetical protein